MIIQIHGATPEQVAAARRSLENLAASWGHTLTDAPAPAPHAPDSHDDKGIDPLSVTSLALSLPSAALAVTDLADRIRKRHRAKELTDRARQLAGQHVTASLVTTTRTTEIRGLTPDQVLDLLTTDDPGS